MKRRDFLQGIGALAVAPLALPLATAKPQSTVSPRLVTILLATKDGRWKRVRMRELKLGDYFCMSAYTYEKVPWKYCKATSLPQPLPGQGTCDIECTVFADRQAWENDWKAS